jgi:hypothetical protein
LLKLPRPTDKIILVGLGISCFDFVHDHYNNFETDWEVWTINAGAKCFRHDIVFDMHTPEWLDEKIRQAGKPDAPLKRREWMKDHDRPIVMPEANPDYPTSIAYPWEEVIENVGTPYFANGMAYPLALAMASGVKQIKLFGIDFSYARDTATHDEQGRACCEYWIGRMIERGVKVGHSNVTHLLDANTRQDGSVYGYHKKLKYENGKFAGFADAN